MLLKKLGSRVLDLIYPPVCVLCGEYSAGEHLCPRCAASLDSLRSDGSQEAEICRLNPGLELLVTPFLYTGAMRSLLLRLKTTPDTGRWTFWRTSWHRALPIRGFRR